MLLQTIIRYPNAHRVESLVVSVDRLAMRVVPCDGDDTVELRLSYGRWIDESGEPVEFEAFIAGDDNASRGSWNAARIRVSMC